MADNLATFMCRFSWNLGASTFWNPLSLSRPVMELLLTYYLFISWAWWRGWYSDWLRIRRSGDRIPVGERFSAPVQTAPGAHPTSCTMDTGSFPGVKSGRGVTLTPHHLLVPCPLWAVRTLQSLSACTRVEILPFTFIHFGEFSMNNVRLS